MLLWNGPTNALTSLAERPLRRAFLRAACSTSQVAVPSTMSRMSGRFAGCASHVMLYLDRMKSAQTTRYFHALLPALALLAAALPDTANAQSACPPHYASAPPQLINVKLQSHTRELCSAHFAVLHSGVTRTPIYTAKCAEQSSLVCDCNLTLMSCGGATAT